MAWQECSTVGVRTDSPVCAPAVFINTYTGMCQLAGVAQAAIPAPNVWVSIDLTTVGVPVDAKSVHIREFLIITDGSTSGIPDLATAWKSPAYTAALRPSDLYSAQAIGIGASGGARTNASMWVPCVAGVVHFGWLRGDGGGGTWPDQPVPDYPAGAAYGINATVDAYVR